MSRLHALIDRPRRSLAALATVLVAVGITAASGADFTASSANPSNSFATGTLTMSNSNAGAAVLSASGMRPGDAPTTGQVDIGNTGSLSGDFSLDRGTPDDSDGTNPLSEVLNLEVVDCGVFVGVTAPVCGDAGDVVEYTGTIADMTATALDNYAGGEKHRYEFRVSVDENAGTAYQGDSSEVEFTWAAA